MSNSSPRLVLAKRLLKGLVFEAASAAGDWLSTACFERFRPVIAVWEYDSRDLLGPRAPRPQ